MKEYVGKMCRVIYKCKNGYAHDRTGIVLSLSKFKFSEILDQKIEFLTIRLNEGCDYEDTEEGLIINIKINSITKIIKEE